jgi:hypothetical protein
VDSLIGVKRVLAYNIRWPYDLTGPHGVGVEMMLVRWVTELLVTALFAFRLQSPLLVDSLIGAKLLQEVLRNTLKVFEAKQTSHKYKIRI